ncbi:hypothetical protein Tco_0628813 [Tanacetum coccineum]|uniref:Uncharacterized protein n=1 Tax=Tanacetum coccineum TaxID=301880 RepID=A0ABQ4WRE9_9ASTR
MFLHPMTHLSMLVGVLEADLMKTKKTYSSAYTKLILRVKKLKSQIKIGKARRQARVVLSDDEDLVDDSSKQGRKLSDAEVQEKAKDSEKASYEVSTAGAKKGTASEEVPIVSTVEVSLSTTGGTVTYTRRSAEKRLSYAEAIRLEEQMNEEQRAQIARQWDEEERQRAMAESKSTKKIDWNDPSVIRYHTLKMKPKTIAQPRRNMIKYLKNQGNYKISDFKGMSYNDIRSIFEKVWDFNQNIEPMDAEHGSGKQKSPEKSPTPSTNTSTHYTIPSSYISHHSALIIPYHPPPPHTHLPILPPLTSFQPTTPLPNSSPLIISSSHSIPPLQKLPQPPLLLTTLLLPQTTH